MKIDFLDCSHEVSAIGEPPAQSMVWLAEDLVRRDWCIELDKSELDEIRRLAQFIEDNPLPDLQRRIEDVEISGLRETMARMKSILDHGVGFAVIDRLPMDKFAVETLVEVYWVLGQCIGRPVAQKWNGQIIYHVSDTGQDYSYGVRGSHTAVELNFHTDNAFARMVPDYVGLLCRQAAKRGGVSRFCSLYSVHRRMQELYPEQLARLYQPMLYDRQKEHAESAPPVCLAPYFSWRDSRLFARANASLIRKGYDVAGESIDALLIEALNAIDEVCADTDLWYEAPLERGQIQYLNNHEIGHYRSAFEDHDDAERKRHLYRLWHREAGSADYDGL